jgi:REP element-mobilizing transposase RayT
MYHIVCPAKYRRAVITEEVDEKLKEVCQGIEARYEIKFLEIGTEKDHVHFLYNQFRHIAQRGLYKQ